MRKFETPYMADWFAISLRWIMLVGLIISLGLGQQLGVATSWPLGLIGLFLFLAFQFYLLGDILSLLRRKESWVRFAATAGVFAWVAIALYNFTQDSFTTPNIWLVPGILVGLAGWGANSEDKAVI